MIDAFPVDVLRKILVNHVCAEDWLRVALSSSIFRDCFEKSNKWMTKATSTKATLEWSMRANPECRPGIGWCNSVAREGKLDCLILLRQCGCLWDEMKVLSVLMKQTHVNVCRIFNFYQEKVSQELFVAMEFIPGDDLLEIVLAQTTKFSDFLCFHYISQILQGLHHLHSNKIAHRDLKLENVMLSRGLVKIIDFGLSKIFPEDECTSQSTMGSLGYVCPEILNKSSHNPFLSDMWSLGVCLFALASKSFPFIMAANSLHGQNILQFVRLQKYQTDPQNIPNTFEIFSLQNFVHPSVSNSKYFKELLHTLLQVDEKKRCTCEEAIKKVKLWKCDIVKPNFITTKKRKMDLLYDS